MSHGGINQSCVAISGATEDGRETPGLCDAAAAIARRTYSPRITQIMPMRLAGQQLSQGACSTNRSTCPASGCSYSCHSCDSWLNNPPVVLQLHGTNERMPQ